MGFRFLVCVGVFFVTACAHQTPTDPPSTVRVQILAFNDFHGNLRAPSRGVSTTNGNVEAGGAEFFAAHVAARRATNPNTLVVSAGDLVGASPLLSALFHDEPTVLAMNRIGLDFNGVGNHEFDEGADELLRLSRGGCHPETGCQHGDSFDGARFEFLAANVRREGQDGTLFAPSAVRSFDGVKVAIIGMTLEDTANFVPPVIDDLRFDDEADTANALVTELQKEGVETFVVVVHEGGFAGKEYDGCTGVSGPIVDVVKRMSSAIDVVVTGHTHQSYNCRIDGKIVTSAGSFGLLLTDIDLKIDAASGDVIAAQAVNTIVTRDIPPIAEIQTLVETYETLAAPLANRVVGQIAQPLTTTQNEAGESTLGAVIADAQFAATKTADSGGAQIAMMNVGGIRTDLSKTGDVTFGEIFAVQPFGNTLVTLTLTGAQVDELLEGQWQQGKTRMLTVSSGLRYAWSASAAIGNKVALESILIDGQPIETNGRYRVTVNNYLADRGVLAAGTDRQQGILDLDAIVAYLSANRPLTPPSLDRIRRLD